MSDVCEATALEHVGRSPQILAMCGRYASFQPAEALARMFGTVDAAVVRRHPETGERHLDLLRWGLLPYWTKEPTGA